MTELPGASEWEQIDACLASGVLPRVDEVSRHTRAGDIRHAFLDSALEVGRDKALESLPEDTPPEVRAQCEALDFGRLPEPGSGLSEVSFAYDTNTGAVRCLGKRLGRTAARAMANPHEIVGTLDFLGFDGPDTVVVADYKGPYSQQAPARRHRQLLTYALMASRYYDRPFARVAVAPLGMDGRPRWDADELDILDLDAHETWLKSAATRLMAAREAFAASGTLPRTVAGEHCGRCRARWYCPSQAALVRAVASGDLEAVTRAEAQATGQDEAATAYRILCAASVAVKSAWAQLEGLARVRDVPLPSGKVYGQRARPHSEVAPDAAYNVLRQHFGEAVAEAAAPVQRACSLERVEEAVARPLWKERHAQQKESGVPLRQRATLAGTKAEVEALLRASGALLLTEKSKMGEWEPEVPSAE